MLLQEWIDTVSRKQQKLQKFGYKDKKTSENNNKIKKR